MTDTPKRFTVKDIARYFRVPIHLVANKDDSNAGYFQRLPSYIKAKGRR